MITKKFTRYPNPRRTIDRMREGYFFSKALNLPTARLKGKKNNHADTAIIKKVAVSLSQASGKGDSLNKSIKEESMKRFTLLIFLLSTDLPSVARIIQAPGRFTCMAGGAESKTVFFSLCSLCGENKK